MHRFYPDPEKSRDDLAFLTPEDSRHALTVLRLKPGSTVEVISGGLPWLARIVGEENRIVCVRKLTPLPSTEPKLTVTLFQGIPKADKMDWIIQKATELGVSRIVPVEMERCVVRLSRTDEAKKLERWRKISREAGKQSGRCVLPEILPPMPVRQLIMQDFLPALNVVPWEEADGFGPLALVKAYPGAESLGILIGPEGGISPDEIGLLKTRDFIPITLGRRILRTETAGMAAVAALMCLYGEMERE